MARLNQYLPIKTYFIFAHRINSFNLDLSGFVDINFFAIFIIKNNIIF